MLSVQMEQRVNLKFLVKLGKTFTEAYAMLKEVYGNECLSCTQVFEWFKRFKGKRTKTLKKIGRDTPNLPERLSRGCTTQIRRKLKVYAATEHRGDSRCKHEISFEEESFNKRKVCAKMVPKLLILEQKESRLNICADILNNIDTDPGLLDTMTLKGTRFESVEAVKAKATEVLYQLTEEDFQQCFQQWKSRMERCRDRQGEYIEGKKDASVISKE
ncbi:hypothetical protein NQ318_013099 [Aromia moschata]|uniref:Mos1 transposase HTH domain-containing protein n=1 Tax=Aromia moschata TaxID=1265417 RepID=A0AAV8Y0R3_9CUCU|nr:hypothetical protein NQ318_013099 [Aromia moschata]